MSFISSISLWFFLRISFSPLTLLICSYILAALSFRAFNILIIVVLIFRCDDPNISAMSGSDACSLSSSCIFCILICTDFFLIAGHDVPGKRSCYNQAFSDVVVRCEGGEVFYSPRIRSQSSSEPVFLGCELHKCFSVFPHTHRTIGGKG